MAARASAPAYGALLDAVRGVQWPARAPVRSGSVGTHHSRQRGSSAEFAEYRAYRQGDDPRRLDWKLLARSDRAYVRLATDRAVLPTMIVVDASASMDFPREARESRGGSPDGKWAQATRLAVGLAAVAHATGDPVGLLVPRGDAAQRPAHGAGPGGARAAVTGGAPAEPVMIRPRTRRGVVSELAAALSAISPAGDAGLAPAVSLLAAPAAPRVAIITDLLGDADALLAAARVQVARGGEVHLVHVVAREEIDPPARAMLAVDPERPGVQRALTDATRAAYVATFAEFRARAAADWRAAGAWYTEVTDDEPAERAVRRIASGVA